MKKKSHVLIPFILLGIWLLSQLISCFQSINFIDHLAYKDPRDCSFWLNRPFFLVHVDMVWCFRISWHPDTKLMFPVNQLLYQSFPKLVMPFQILTFCVFYHVSGLWCVNLFGWAPGWRRCYHCRNWYIFLCIVVESRFTINAPSSGHLKNVIDRKM